MNVVPMRMRDQQRHFDGFRAKFFLQSKTEWANPRAGVEHNDFAIGPHFHAGRVAAVTNGCIPRHRN